jgi:beta-glucosidase
MKCNKEYRLTYTDKAQKIVDALSLEEKVSLMSGKVTLEAMLHAMETDPDAHYNHVPYGSGGIEKHHVPEMLFCDGPRGVVCGKGKSTCFPVSMLRGASFDNELEHRIGVAIGKETRAFDGNLFAGVCINLPYNPGWGRSQETYGEESFHLGEMGKALLTGVQEENVIACVKHYAFNQMEIARFKVSVECDIRTEKEVFLPHFKKCVEAGAGSIMSSYNLYKGTYCGHHDYLLNQVLKNDWGFDGFIMSDFGWGIKDTIEAANGGQNMEMCGTEYFGDKLVKAVKEGDVAESNIDDSALRIIRTLLAFTEADKQHYDQSILGCKEHISLALESARKGITLIKNDDQVLPFDKTNMKKVIVLGKLGNKANIGDHGSSQVFPKYVVTPLQGITNVAPNAEVIFYDGEDLAHAKELAREADAVIFVVGYNHDDEGEFISEEQTDNYTGTMGGDRVKSLDLHDDEIRLLNEVGPANTQSVAVLIGGNTIMMESWKKSVSAVLMAYYPGMEGGTAIAEIIVGDINPSGKLPYVVPFDEKDLPQVNWDAEQQYYDYYHGYAKLEKENITPSIPYGFGLSYTTFDISDANFGCDEHELWATCSVTNTGSREGTEVVQLYVGFNNSKVDRPKKLLRGFARVALEKGNTKVVRISCPLEEVMYFNPEHNQFELEEMVYQLYIGTSSDENDLLCGDLVLTNPNVN